MQNARLDELQARIKAARRNINNLRYTDDITLMAESKEELKSLLRKVKEQSERGEWKGWLKMQHSKNKDHGIQSHHFMANRWGNKGNSDRLFTWTKKSLQMVTAAMKLKVICSLEEKTMTKLDSILKSRKLAYKGSSSEREVFFSSHVWMWELDYKESWAWKNWCSWTLV